MRLRGAAAGVIATLAGLQSVEAAEWRFCIAPANQEHRIYMTAPFSTTVPMETMEGSFHQVLDRANRPHDSVQCPTGPSEQAVRAMRQHADEFNRQLGIEIVTVDWRPSH